MGLFDRIVRVLRRRHILKKVRELRTKTVSDIMTKYVVTVRPDDDVIKAATKMIAEDISCLVVAEHDKPVGIISERDFLRKVPLKNEVFEMKVKDIMSPALITVPPTMPLPTAVALMKEKRIRRLVVMEGDRMLGVVTQTDFTRTLGKLFGVFPQHSALSVGAIMTKNVLTINPTNSVSDAKQRMLKNDVGAIIIKDKETVLGIFTEYDIVMQFYDQHGKLTMNDISKYMRKYVRAVPVETSIFSANKLMLEKNMRRLLIVSGAQVAGIITQTDICRFTYCNLDLLEQCANDPASNLRRVAWTAESHGEFSAEHLKVYTLE